MLLVKCDERRRRAERKQRSHLFILPATAEQLQSNQFRNTLLILGGDEGEGGDRGLGRGGGKKGERGCHGNCSLKHTAGPHGNPCIEFAMETRTHICTHARTCMY